MGVVVNGLVPVGGNFSFLWYNLIQVTIFADWKEVIES